MKTIKLMTLMLVCLIPTLTSAQNTTLKKYSVQEYVKDRKDWEKNLSDSEIMVLENGYAIGGYDPVAYFTKEKALKGRESIKSEWKNATWLFTSEEHKNFFEKSPEKYAPQYGGWSLIHMSGDGGEGFAARTRPEDSWIIVEDKLYMIHVVEWANHFRKNKDYVKNYAKYADKQWPEVSKSLKAGAKTFWPSLYDKDYGSHEMRPILAQTEFMVLHNGYAIGGYDPVAYFEIGEATKGKEEINYEWKGANWLFSSRKHYELFKANPEKYAPQYGGWCSYGMSGHGSDGYGAQSRPNDSWSIVDEKLYLNWSPGVKQAFLKEKDKYISDADREWQKVRKDILEGKEVHWKYF
ncbi:MAG: YHS domain-containing (seleno)protein [Saonia sp.]